jgi:hypothetical protein
MPPQRFFHITTIPLLRLPRKSNEPLAAPLAILAETAESEELAGDPARGFKIAKGAIRVGNGQRLGFAFDYEFFSGRG